MGANSKIEWTHHTHNPWWGCARVSPGCEHCYAETFDRRVHGAERAHWGHGGPRRFMSDKHWAQPLRWQEAAVAAGERHRVFCASMADVFELHPDPQVSALMQLERARLWRLIGETPALDWLLLTKRPENVAQLVPWPGTWPRNVWLGVTGEDQRRLEQRLEHVEAFEHLVSVVFLSCEPLLGPVSIREHRDLVDWVIVGGESGGHARPMAIDWARQLRDEAQEFGIPFFFKQWGAWGPDGGWPIEGLVRLGKKATGRVLDGRTWEEVPVAHVP